MSFSPQWKREDQAAQMGAMQAIAERHRPMLEEWRRSDEPVDLHAGCEVVPIAVYGVSCAHCWGQRKLWEPTPLGGLCPVICERCGGRGFEPGD